MPNKIEDMMIDETDYVFDGLDLAADLSEQGSDSASRIMCYALVAMPKHNVDKLNLLVSRVLDSHLKTDTATEIEIHAKSIWNGSERMKGPFSRLQTKQEMKNLISDIARAFRRVCPYAVVAIDLSQNHPGVKRRRGKQWLLYTALGRLNTNLKYFTGKHLGTPRLLIDPENENLSASHVNGQEVADMFVELGSVWIKDQPKLFKSIDTFQEVTHSHTHRLVQVADVAAYFVGKYLTNYSTMLAQIDSGLEENPDGILRKIEDINFFFAIWDILNIEVVAFVEKNNWDKMPSWLKSIVNPYQPILEAGVTYCTCSIRDAFPIRSMSQCVGYWIISKDGIHITQQDLSHGF